MIDWNRQHFMGSSVAKFHTCGHIDFGFPGVFEDARGSGLLGLNMMVASLQVRTLQVDNDTGLLYGVGQ